MKNQFSDRAQQNAGIWAAIKGGDISLLGQVLRSDPTLANETDKFGRVPLFYLASLKDSGMRVNEQTRQEMIALLVETPGVNLRAEAGYPANGVSIMSMALSAGDTYLCEILLRSDPTLANETDKFGRLQHLSL